MRIYRKVSKSTGIKWLHPRHGECREQGMHVGLCTDSVHEEPGQHLGAWCVVPVPGWGECWARKAGPQLPEADLRAEEERGWRVGYLRGTHDFPRANGVFTSNGPDFAGGLRAPFISICWAFDVLCIHHLGAGLAFLGREGNVNSPECVEARIPWAPYGCVSVKWCVPRCSMWWILEAVFGFPGPFGRPH